MQRTSKLGAFLAVAFLFMGFSYSLRFECNVSVSGNVETSLAALKKFIVENGGELVHARSGETSWYAINDTNLTLKPSVENRISIDASVLMGNGCARSKVKDRASELLERLVAQASHESGIKMQVSGIKEAERAK